MKDKLQNVFKEPPERFTYTIESALSEARNKSKTRRFSTPFRVVIAVILILAILPSAVFGAVKMCGVIAQKAGNYGVAIDININEDAPKFVRMNVDVPEGFKEQPDSGGLKFHRDCDEWVFGFTIMPMRFYESIHYNVIERNVKEYTKMTIASRPSYELTGTDDYQGLRRYFVWYEEANVLILIYRGETVTDDELEAFVNSITFTEGTEEDHDRFFEPENNSSEMTDDTASYYEYEYNYVEMQKDAQLTFIGWNETAGESELQVKSKIKDIRVTDNVNGLDTNDIYPSFDINEVADSKGKLLPKTIEIWQTGDGVNTESKLLSCESKEQKLVLIDIEYVNTTDKEVTLFIPHRLKTLTKDAYGNYKDAVEIDKAQAITATEYCDIEVFYMSSHGSNDKDFYCPVIMPNETRTITIGFRCIDEQLSNAYLVLNPITDGVLAPDYSDNPNTYLIFKVQ